MDGAALDGATLDGAPLAPGPPFSAEHVAVLAAAEDDASGAAVAAAAVCDASADSSRLAAVVLEMRYEDSEIRPLARPGRLVSSAVLVGAASAAGLAG